MGSFLSILVINFLIYRYRQLGIESIHLILSIVLQARISTTKSQTLKFYTEKNFTCYTVKKHKYT